MIEENISVTLGFSDDFLDTTAKVLPMKEKHDRLGSTDMKKLLLCEWYFKRIKR